MSTYTDWVLVVSDFFGDAMRSLSIVELGKGESTLFLTQNFAKVYSIEYTRYPFTATWEVTGLPNHVLETLTPISNLLQLDNILVSSKGKVRPPELRLEAERLHSAALNYDAEVLFIDHGCHNRGEVLELAKKAKWKYIIIHDTNFPYYGYDLRPPEGFSVHQNLVGQGTIIFERTSTNFLSIIIPTTGRSTLTRSLDSLLSQTNPNWVAHVGFDGIPCDKGIIKEDSRITYHTLKKRGGGHNYGGEVRNVLISKSTTPWICFLDDDDSFRKNYVEMFYREHTRHPEADVIMFRMSFNPEDTDVLPLIGANPLQKFKVGISFAVRLTFLQKHNLCFKNGFIEDYVLLESIKNKGGNFLFSNYIGYNIRF